MFADGFDYLIKSFQGKSFWNFRHFLRNFEAFPRLLPGWFTLKSFLWHWSNDLVGWTGFWLTEFMRERTVYIVSSEVSNNR